ELSRMDAGLCVHLAGGSTSMAVHWAPRSIGDLPRRRLLQRREWDLLGRHAEEWIRPLHPLAGGCTFPRGFVETVELPPAQLLDNADAIFRHHPVRGLYLDEVAGHLKELLQLPQLARLTALNIHGDLGTHAIGADGARLLAASPHLASLTD